MLRRTLFAIGALAGVAGKRLRSQSRGELQRRTDEQLASTPHKSADIMALSSPDLVKILNDSGASEFAKAKACQRLAVVGDESAAPALAKLLSDDRLAHYARTALEPMPGNAADRALRGALSSLDGMLLVGAIHSLGVRRDVEALPVLAKFRQHDDAEVVAAATWAISRIWRP